MRGRQLAVLGVVWLALAAAALFYEFRRQPQIVVQWETETEMNTAGFHVYRSDSGAGKPERLNDQLIVSRGDLLTGARYEFVDAAVRPNHDYTYYLEEVELDGAINRLDTIETEAKGVEAWVVAVAGLGLVVGAYLISAAGRAQPFVASEHRAPAEGAESNDRTNSVSDPRP